MKVNHCFSCMLVEEKGVEAAVYYRTKPDYSFSVVIGLENTKDLNKVQIAQKGVRELIKHLGYHPTGVIIENGALGFAECCLDCFMGNIIYAGDLPIELISCGPVLCARGCGHDQISNQNTLETIWQLLD